MAGQFAASMAPAKRTTTRFRQLWLVILAGVVAHQAEGWHGQAYHTVSQLLPDKCCWWFGWGPQQYELHDRSGRFQYVSIHARPAEGALLLQEGRESRTQAVRDSGDQGTTMGSVSEGSTAILSAKQEAVPKGHQWFGERDAASCCHKPSSCCSGASIGLRTPGSCPATGADGHGHPGRRGLLAFLYRPGFREQCHAGPMSGSGPAGGPQACSECTGFAGQACGVTGCSSGFKRLPTRIP